MKRMCLLLVLSCTVLSGCATLQVLSFGASSLSYAVSGKSLSDHAISTVMNQDCALHRPLMGESTCVNHQNYGVLRSDERLALSNHAINHHQEQMWQYVDQTVTPNDVAKPVVKSKLAKFTAKPNANPDEVVLNLMTQQTNKPIATSANQQPMRKMQPEVYAVVGSFNQLRYALDNVRRQQNLPVGLSAQIVANSEQVIAQGATKYRVVVGPMKNLEFDSSIGDVGDRVNYHAWRLTLCTDTMQPPPCHSNLSATMTAAR